MMSNSKKLRKSLLRQVYLLLLSAGLYAQPCPQPNPIIGSPLVCPGSQTVYQVTTDNSPTSTYQWEIFGTGGQIVGPTNGTSVTIDWQSSNGGPYTLRCTETIGMCFMQNEAQITIADDLARHPFNCFSEISIPLDQNCEKLILPEHLLSTGAPECDNSFIIELSINGDIQVPNPVTIEYIGQIITAKVIHPASGRSCESLITFKDGSIPRLQCENDTALCNDQNAWTPFDTSFKIPVVTDNCTDSLTPEPQGYEWIQLLDDPVFDAYIIRSWQAIDKYGNRGTCDDTIFLRKVVFDDIVCPPDTLITCDSGYFEIDDPLTSGVPTYEGLPLWSSRTYCDFTIKFEDQISYKCPGTYTIHRYWFLSQVTDTAINEDTCHQIIEIVDTTGPTALFDSDKVEYEIHDDVFGLPSDREYKTVHFPTLDYDCQAYGYFPTPIIDDNCTSVDSVVVDLIWDNGHINYLNGSLDGEHLRFENLSAGKHIVTIKLRDACHNTSYDTLIAVAEDLRPPYLSADLHPIVTLGAFSDVTWINVSVFDEGTWDNCGLKVILGRRADWDTACGYTEDSTAESAVRDHYENYWNWWIEDTDSFCLDSMAFGYSDQIPFCCDDACSGEKVAIELLAIDEHCNISKLKVHVVVEDKSAPKVQHVLQDLNISCWAYNKFYKEQVEQGDFSVFGSYEPYGEGPYAGEAGKTVIKDRYCILDPEEEHYYRIETDTISNGLVIENCDLEIEEHQKVFFERCGEGWIERHFVLKGACNSSKADSTKVIQKINIYNDCPLQEHEIIWPLKDTTVYECGYVEVETEGPRLIHEDDCREIGINFKDRVTEVLFNADSTCLKVIRTWAIIDWCRQTAPYHDEWIGDQNYHYYEYEQIIYIKNAEAPEITDCDIDTLCIGQQCSATLMKSIRVQDDCTPTEDIEVSWSLYQATDLGYRLLDKADTNYAEVPNLAMGDYKLVWTAEDACHNESICTDYFAVKDCVKPTPICATSTTLRLIPVDLNQDGLIDTAVGEIWAEELDVSSHDNCGGIVDFRIRRKGTGDVDGSGRLLAPDTTEKRLGFGCADKGVQEVEMWVVDDRGNADFCLVTIIVTGPAEGCDGELGRVQGTVSSMQGAGLADVQAILRNEDGTEQFSVTDDKGRYDFGGFAMDGTSYSLWPEKEDDPVDGISTLDAIRISKHMLARDKFESSFEYRAADVNGDGHISVKDIILLRRLILGKIDTLPNPRPWLFYNRDMDEVSEISIHIDYHPLTSFTGVKVGDVNGDVARFNNAARDGSKDYMLSFVDQYFDPGDDVVLMLEGEKEMLEGLQLGLQFDPSILEFISVQGLSETLGEEHWATSEGNLRISWINEGELQEKVSLKVIFSAKGFGRISDLIGIDDARLESEVYCTVNKIRKIGIVQRNDELSVVKVSQNAPNPFSENTVINIDVGKNVTGMLKIYDLSGRVFVDGKKLYEKGNHKINVSRIQLGGPGIYVYEFVTEKEKITKKMILLK